MRHMDEDNLTLECISELIAMEQKWGIKLCTEAVYQSQRPKATDTADVNRRLAQLERCMWGHTCGPEN